MNSLPELSDDAIIDLQREGGVAFIPALRRARRFALAQLTAAQKQRVCSVLERALPLGEPEARSPEIGRGDQCFFRIQISYSSPDEKRTLVLIIPEQGAPPELENLWRDGE